MQAMTAENLRSAFCGESMAHMRYKAWSERAEKDGFPNVARLFTAVSRSEQAHAIGHFKALAKNPGSFLVPGGAGFGIGKTAENLQGAINGENHEIDQMYPAFLMVAQAQGEKDAVRSITYAAEAEKTHSAMYAAAKKAVDGGKDAALGTLRVCPICGRTVEGDAPDRCPICGAPGSQYVAFA